MKKLLLILIVVSSFYGKIHGQSEFRKGIVVTNKGDTLKGLITYREGARRFKDCSFKKTKDSDVTVYAADQIHSYGFENDAYYVSKSIETDNGESEKVFFEVLVMGKLILYRFSQRFFVEKSEMGLHELINTKSEVIVSNVSYSKESKKHIGVLIILTNDCKGFKKTLSEVKINEKELTELVERYNNCSGGESVSFKKDKPWFKAQFGLVVGLNSSQLNFSGNNAANPLLNSDFDRANSIMPGIIIDLFTPRINEKFSFNTGLFYLSSNHKSFDQSFGPSDQKTRTEIAVNLKQLKIPIALKYTFREKGVAPYINGGLSYAIKLEASSNYIIEREANNVVNTFEGESEELTMNPLSYWGGIGIKKSIAEKFGVFAEFRFEYNPEGVMEIIYPEQSIPGGSLQNLQLLIGLSF